METLISKKKDTSQTADGGGDRKPAADGEQYRNRCQSNQGDGRRELSVAHEDQYLWKAQNTYADNDHMSNAT